MSDARGEGGGQLFADRTPDEAVLEAQRAYQEVIESLLLDNSIPFNDRLKALVATQGDDFRPDGAETIGRKLNWATKDGLVLMTAADMMVLGALDPDQPWNFIDVDSSGVAPILALEAHFAKAFRISDNGTWLHESFGQSSLREETKPDLKELPDRIDVKLPVFPRGTEHLLTKIGSFANSLAVGVFNIHKEVTSTQSEKKPKEQAALHAAVSLAITEIKS